ncbi:MAG: hypothetical protein ACYC7D_15450 [Nitrososphaerales archaeon]
MVNRVKASLFGSMRSHKLLLLVVLLLFSAPLLSTVRPAHANTTSPALDGSSANNCSGNGSPTGVCSTSLSTSNANDVIYVCGGNYGITATLTISDTSTLTWHNRLSQSGTFSGQAGAMFCWYAIATTTLSGDTISVSGYTIGGGQILIAFGISNAYTPSPIDPGVTSPPFNSGSSAPPSASISTSESNDFIIGVEFNKFGATLTPSAGFTMIYPSGTATSSTGAEYDAVSTPQTGLTVGFTQSNSNVWFMTADAITAVVNTSTSVSCSPSFVAAGSQSTCTATVTGSSPTGTITWGQSSSNGGSVTFSPTTCSLASGSCSVTATGASVGWVTIQGSYGGDSNNGASSDIFSLTVFPQQTATTTVTQTTTVTSTLPPITSTTTETQTATSTTTETSTQTLTATVTSTLPPVTSTTTQTQTQTSTLPPVTSTTTQTQTQTQTSTLPPVTSTTTQTQTQTQTSTLPPVTSTTTQTQTITYHYPVTTTETTTATTTSSVTQTTTQVSTSTSSVPITVTSTTPTTLTSTVPTTVTSSVPTTLTTTVPTTVTSTSTATTTVTQTPSSTNLALLVETFAPGGTPLPGTAVNLTASPSFFEAKITNASGEVTFTGLSAGPYHVSSIVNHTLLATPINLVDNATVVLDPSALETSAVATISSPSGGTTVPVTLFGNETGVAIKQLQISLDSQNNSYMVNFQISGTAGTSGFANVTIPKSAVPSGYAPTVYIDGIKAADQSYTQDQNNYYVYFVTHFSTHQVTFSFTHATTTRTASTHSTTGSSTSLLEVSAAVVIAVVIFGALLVLRKKRR